MRARRFVVRLLIVLLRLCAAGLWCAVALRALPAPGEGVTPNPLHGIHAPVGSVWRAADIANMAAFRNARGENGVPGMVVALDPDLLAAGNAAGVTMEQSLHDYALQGSTIFVRMWPQRFPGGTTDAVDYNKQAISGTPGDAANDILGFLRGQEERHGWHFTHIIPGNEMNIEWPDTTYNGQPLPWGGAADPAKYDAIDRFYTALYAAWQTRVAQPDAAAFRDVQLYYPALAQDGNGTGRVFGGFYFYDHDAPIGQKYDHLRTSIETFRRITWHNYFKPGAAWQTRAIATFPQWLKDDLTRDHFPGYITECGWDPDLLKTQTQDDVINGVRFEDDVRWFIENASGAADDHPAAASGVAVWLESSNGVFTNALGVVGYSHVRDADVRRWFAQYAAWPK